MINKKDYVIFFIHGFCGSSLNNKILENNFIKDGYKTISFDLPGHGNDYKNFIKKGRKDWIKKVEEEFEKIKNYKNIVIIGFSMGANLAILLYKNHRKIEKKLNEKNKNIKINIKIILLSPAFSVNNKFFPSFFHIFKAFLAHKEFKFKSTNPGCNNPEYINFYKNYHNNIPAKRFFDLYILIIMAKKNIKYIDVPILIIHSKHDLISPYAESLKTFKKIPNESKVFITLSKSNHFIQLDYEKSKVYELSKSFIEKEFNNFIKESTTSTTTT